MHRFREILILIGVTVGTTIGGCGGQAADNATDTSSPAITAPARPERDRPVHVINIDLRNCGRQPGADDRFRVIAHETNAEQHTPAFEAALIKAIHRSASAYGWAPVEPVCVHVFSSDNAFIQGLQELGQFPPSESFKYRSVIGTVGYDQFSRREAIFMNTVATTQPKQAAYLVTHEYFHIVQNHVANVNAPMWYLEGMAEWEAFRLVGAPIPTWLAILLTDERQGRSHPFSTLETSEQWWQINRGASPYFKATAAILYLERLAGADAPIDVLRGTGVDSASFELIFSSVSGMGVEEFENTLPQFLEELYLEQLATQTPLP